MKANPGECHLLINTDESVALKIKNETVTNSSNQKLLGILFNNKFDFGEHVTSLSLPEPKCSCKVVYQLALYELGIIMVNHEYW